MRVSLEGNKVGQRDRGEARARAWAPQSPGSGALGRRPAWVSRGPTVGKEWGRRRVPEAAEGLPRVRGPGVQSGGSARRVFAGLRGFHFGDDDKPPGCWGRLAAIWGPLPNTTLPVLGWGDPCLRPPSGQGQAVQRAGPAHGVCCPAGHCAAVLGPPGLTQRPLRQSPPASRAGHPGPRPACWSPPPSALVRSLCA